MQKTNSKVRKDRTPDDKKKESVMDYIHNKKSISTIASERNVSGQAVRNWVNDYRNSKQTEPSPLIENITDYVYANIIPTPLVYTLAEAASVAKISINLLLHYASLGKITLFFDRPIDVLVMSKKDIESVSEKFSSFSATTLKTTSNNGAVCFYDARFDEICSSFKFPFLVISRNDCSYLEMGLGMSSYRFVGVYSLNKDNDLTLEMLSRDNKNQEDFYYTLKKDMVKSNQYIEIKEDCHAIDISKKMLKVSSRELDELISSEIKRKANREASQEQFALHENKSTYLVELDQAAFELWGDFNPIKAAVFNTSDKVGEYLVDNFQFCKANALPLAVIISPSANNPILPTKEDAKEITYRPRLLSGVIQAWGAVCMAKKFLKGDNSIKYQEEVNRWLTCNWPELTKYEKTISNVVKLITPDNAPFDKLRKSKK